MPTLYTHARYFRDNGNTWGGRWGLNRNNACLGNGFGIGYDKGMYSDPVRENCAPGVEIVAITQLAAVDDPNLRQMLEALEKNPDDPGSIE